MTLSRMVVVAVFTILGVVSTASADDSWEAIVNRPPEVTPVAWSANGQWKLERVTRTVLSCGFMTIHEMRIVRADGTRPRLVRLTAAEQALSQDGDALAQAVARRLARRFPMHRMPAPRAARSRTI